MSRLVQITGAVRANHPSLSLLVVVNKTGRGTFRRMEIVNEVGRVVPDLPTVTLPYETRLEQAAWDGTLLAKGRYGRAVGEVADVVVRSLR